ncbi:MAG: type II toxin-antitoxin system HicA family toxin [Spirochaetaceae bacterium]
MAPVPSISFSELRTRIESLGFEPRRQKGSHVRYVHPDGRSTTIPDHGSKDVPRGLPTKILRHDVGITLEEFLRSSRR